MRTASTLTISPSTLCSGGCTWSWGVYLVRGGVCCRGGVPDPGGVCLLQGQCTWSWGCAWSQGGVPGPGAVCLLQGGCVSAAGGCIWSWRGCAWSWGVYLVLGGVSSWGVSALGGVPGPRGCTWSGTPPSLWTEWHTLLKILPCPKLRLRAVTSRWSVVFRVGDFSLSTLLEHHIIRTLHFRFVNPHVLKKHQLCKYKCLCSLDELQHRFIRLSDFSWLLSFPSTAQG